METLQVSSILLWLIFFFRAVNQVEHLGVISAEVLELRNGTALATAPPDID